MTKLVKIAKGTWIDSSVVSYVSPIRTFINPTTASYAVDVHVAGRNLSWEFDTAEEASEFANKIASTVNETR